MDKSLPFLTHGVETTLIDDISPIKAP